METLAQRLNRLRTERNMSLREVAGVVGVSPSTYRAWEHGTEINGEPYMRMAKLYNVSLVELMTGEKNEINRHIEQIENTIRAIRAMM